MDLPAALRALSPEDLLRVAEVLAPVIATIPTRSTIESYRADGRVTVRFEMKLGGEWRDVGIYHATHGLSRTWIDPEPGCDRSGACGARLHYEDCGAALWRRRRPDDGRQASPLPDGVRREDHASGSLGAHPRPADADPAGPAAEADPG